MCRRLPWFGPCVTLVMLRSRPVSGTWLRASYMSDQIRSDQIRSDQIRSDQIRSDQIRRRFPWFRPCVRSVMLRLRPVSETFATHAIQTRSDQIGPHQIRSDQIRSDQIRSDHVSKYFRANGSMINEAE